MTEYALAKWHEGDREPPSRMADQAREDAERL
jgi:hypothetical protein